MWKQFAKDYLSFSRRERRAVLLLLALILLIFVLPYWWPARKAVASGAPVLQSLERPPAADGASRRAGGNTDSDNRYLSPGSSSPGSPAASPRLFYFDPNTLAAEGWRQLGLRDKTIRTILHYREKGGYFHRPEDIGKIYGLLPAEYMRLLPYARIAQPAYMARYKSAAPVYASSVYKGKPYHYGYAYKPPLPRSIDVNTADTTAFIALPGIGSRLASRIVNFREKLGGFYCVEQVGETYALPDSVFMQVKSILRCDSNAIRRININTADVNTLRQHPYIHWNIANAIVAYRAQHGDYKSVDELQRIEIITPADWQRLRYYLYVP